MMIAIEQFEDMVDIHAKLTPEFCEKLRHVLNMACIHGTGRPIKLCISTEEYPPLALPSLSEIEFGKSIVKTGEDHNAQTEFRGMFGQRTV